MNNVKPTVNELKVKQKEIEKQITEAGGNIDNSQAAPLQEHNPLLTRVQIPGSTFQIPSRGLFYHDNELSDDVKLGEVHIHAMSAFDEILMKTPDALFSGEAVNKVFKRCIPQILKPIKLLAKDVDFLLVCLRQITYGNNLEINYNHQCNDEAKTHAYTVDINTFLQNTIKLDPTTVGKLYSFTLDNGQIIKLRPTKFEDLIKMYQDSDPKKTRTAEEELQLSTFAIKSVIEAVDEVSNGKFIEEWIKQISAGWISDLSKVIEKTSNFGTEFKFKTVCKDCNKDITIETPINPISFFL